jgi:hypothetical protein
VGKQETDVAHEVPVLGASERPPTQPCICVLRMLRLVAKPPSMTELPR